MSPESARSRRPNRDSRLASVSSLSVLVFVVAGPPGRRRLVPGVNVHPEKRLALARTGRTSELVDSACCSAASTARRTLEPACTLHRASPRLHWNGSSARAGSTMEQPSVTMFVRLSRANSPQGPFTATRDCGSREAAGVNRRYFSSSNIPAEPQSS